MAVSWTNFLISVGGALGIGLTVIVAVHLAGRALARRWPPAEALSSGTRRPFRIFTVAVAVAVATDSSHPGDVNPRIWGDVQHVVHVVAIVAGAWLLTEAVLFLEDLGLSRYRTDVPDNRMARQKRTQGLIIRRLTIGIMVIVALGAVLLSFPAVKAVGASVLASAGVASVVAALAAQSTLGNVFAGIQLAFNDAIRLGDAVIVEGEWGWIEELTLTYVVVRLWDERRMVMPSTYFTTTPFQNWTRSTTELLGTVELDLDWRVDTAGMRNELDRILGHTDLWDQRAKALQVTDAVGGSVRVRALVSAADAGRLFDLRCLVRERLVAWVQKTNPGALPRHRMQVGPLEAQHAADEVDRFVRV